MNFPDQQQSSEENNDIYTDDYLMKLPSKRVISQAPEYNQDIPQNIPQASSGSQSKKGLGGLSGLMKGETSANSYLMTKYNIFINLNLNGQLLIEELILELPNDCTVEECIKQSIKLFLQRFERNKIQSYPPNSNISQNIDDYLLYFANKKGERKLDLPGLELSQVLSNTHFFRFAILQKQTVHKQKQIEIQQEQQKTEEAKNVNQKEIDLPKKSENNQQYQQQLQKKSKNNDTDEFYQETCCLCFTIRRQKKK